MFSRFHSLSGNTRGGLVLMLAAAGFAVMAAIIKLLGEQLHVTQILFLRQCGMLLIILPSITQDFLGTLYTSRPGLQIIRATFALIAMLCGFTAFINMPLADVTAIGFSKSFFVTIFAVLILHETVGPRRWFAVLIGFVGVLFMVRPGSNTFDFYSVYALIGAASAGVVMVVIRLLSRTESSKSILAYQTIMVGLVMCVPGIIYWQTPSLTDWGLLAALGLVSYVSQKCNILAYSWGEASMLASLDYVRLIYATVFGYVLFSNLPDVYTWIGALIIVVASIYTIHREAQLGKSKVNLGLASGPNARGYTSGH